VDQGRSLNQYLMTNYQNLFLLKEYNSKIRQTKGANKMAREKCEHTAHHRNELHVLFPGSTAASRAKLAEKTRKQKEEKKKKDK